MFEIISAVLITIASLVYIFYPLISSSCKVKEIDWEN